MGVLSDTEAQNLTKYVNPFVGTDAHGHTFPGATTPFGMVQLSPDTRIDGSWDGCSGYHYSDSLLYGFSHTHLSGTGCSDYGDISFMPSYVDEKKFNTESTRRPEITTAKFTHKNEKASVGYYFVGLDDIDVELSASTRAGIQRYTFKKDGMACISLNLSHRDQLLSGKITKVDQNNYQGFRRSKAWAEDQLVYYAFEISKKELEAKIFRDEASNSDEVLYLYFKVKKDEQIIIKTGISSVDEKNAALNLSAEIPHWDLDLIHKQAVASWETALKKIEVIDPNERNKATFYTALYHCMIHPNVMSDVDGRYRGRDTKIHTTKSNYYTLYSLWDTHRALHPLLNIIEKERSKDFMLSFLAQYQQSGRLPMWELWNNETNCMIGFHSVSVILDAYVKNVIDKNLLTELYPAVKAEAMSDRFGLDKFRKRGYLQVDDESESVSKTLEYCYDMWCVSEIAKILGQTKDAEYFGSFTQAWRNVYDVNTGYMRPRKNGDWLKPFNPYEVNNHYTEANAWQYSYFIPHSNEKPKNVLKLFEASTKTAGREQSDITGLVGQYAHGNEPSHNYVYLLDHQHKQKYIKQIIDSLYSPEPDGLCGNDDCGQMSAWYVFSAMGFYPVCPGKAEYEFGYPLFKTVKIHLDDKRYFTIYNNKKNNISYPTVARGSIVLTDLALPQAKLYHGNIVSNYTLIFSDKFFEDQINSTGFIEKPILCAPVISSAGKVFNEFINVELSLPDRALDSTIELYYSIDSANVKQAQKYNGPFMVNKSCTVYAFAKQQTQSSNISSAYYHRIPHNWEIQLRSNYNRQYTADGPNGIIDGLRGDLDWRKGGWQGYQSQDFEANIDLKRERDIKRVSIGFLQDTRSWILMPRQVEIWTSNDGNIFRLNHTIYNTVADVDYKVQIKDFSAVLKDVKARYIKIKAQNYGTLPTWHQGNGGDAFIFVDEIFVE
jgi:predicted alpha-1,2-mannosidase